MRCQVTVVILSRGRLGGNAKGITSWMHQLLGTDQCWAEVLAFQMACQLSLGPWRQGHAVVGSEAPSVPSVLRGTGESSSESKVCAQG